MRARHRRPVMYFAGLDAHLKYVSLAVLDRRGRIHSQLHQQRLSLPREKLLRQATRAWLEETAWPRLTVEQQAIVTTHVGPRGARLGDPDPRALGADESGDDGVRAAEGPTRVAGGASSGRPEVGPRRLCDADPPDALVWRPGGWRRQGRGPKLTCRCDDLILLIDPSRSYSQIMRP